MKHKHSADVFSAVRRAIRNHKILTVCTILCVAASVLASLIPPLLLADIIDNLTGGIPLVFTAAMSVPLRWKAFFPPRRKRSLFCWVRK